MIQVPVSEGSGGWGEGGVGEGGSGSGEGGSGDSASGLRAASARDNMIVATHVSSALAARNPGTTLGTRMAALPSLAHSRDVHAANRAPTGARLG